VTVGTSIHLDHKGGMTPVTRNMNRYCSTLSLLRVPCIRTGRSSHLISIIACLALLGCASVPQSVSVPVAVSCIPQEIPGQPSISTDQTLAAMSDYELVLRIAAERLELLAYVKQVQPILEACK
jgi:hypothetical protein